VSWISLPLDEENKPLIFVGGILLLDDFNTFRIASRLPGLISPLVFSAMAHGFKGELYC
jgi:hypothetical protein